MHELSLANEICDIVEREVRRDRGAASLAHVTVVAVEVGADANVEHESLRFCLDALLSTHPFRRGSALIDVVAGDDLRVSWFEIDDAPGTALPADTLTPLFVETDA
jgi:hypothetical protein